MKEIELKPCKICGKRSNALGGWLNCGLIERVGKRVKIPIAKCPHCVIYSTALTCMTTARTAEKK